MHTAHCSERDAVLNNITISSSHVEKDSVHKHNCGYPLGEAIQYGLRTVDNKYPRECNI